MPARRFGRMISRGSLASFSSSSTTICRQHGVGPQSSARHPSSNFKVLIKPAVSTPALTPKPPQGFFRSRKCGIAFSTFQSGPLSCPPCAGLSVGIPFTRSIQNPIHGRSLGRKVDHLLLLPLLRPPRKTAFVVAAAAAPWPLDRILSATLRFSTYLRQERSPLVGSSVQTCSGASLFNADSLFGMCRISYLHWSSSKPI